MIKSPAGRTQAARRAPSLGTRRPEGRATETIVSRLSVYFAVSLLLNVSI